MNKIFYLLFILFLYVINSFLLFKWITTKSYVHSIIYWFFIIAGILMYFIFFFIFIVVLSEERTKNIPTNNQSKIQKSTSKEEIPDPLMPWDDDDWDKVNYIINNKQGNAMQIQKAIWHFIDGGYSGNDTVVLDMIDEAELYGDGFVPSTGEWLAVLCDAGDNIQRTFIEVDP